VDVAFAALPAYGHLYPLMPLALATAEAGHRVTVATGALFADRLPLPTVKAFPDHATLSWVEQQTAERFVAEEGVGFGVRMFADVAANVSAESLLPQWDERRPDLVVLDSGNLGAAVAAHVLGIPAVAVAVGVWAPFGPPAYAAVLDYAAEQWHRRGATPPADPRHLLAAFVDPLPAALQQAAPDGIRHLPMRSVGFSHGAAPLPAWLAETATRPRVLLTLGTVAYEAVHVIRTALEGLLELDVDVLVVLGPQGDPDALAGLPDRVHLHRFVPQEQVLPLLDLVVHHGGSGNLLGGLGHGLPALVLPQGADQHVNAARLVEAGAGRALQGDELVATAVRDAVAAMLPDRSPERTRAREIAAEMAAMPAPADVVPALEGLAAS
jgi:UDP:flavonoid glycosyltransferase YjiC (YdhE family)